MINKNNISRIVFKHKKYKELGTFEVYIDDSDLLIDNLKKLINKDFEIYLKINKNIFNDYQKLEIYKCLKNKEPSNEKEIYEFIEIINYA